MAFNWEEEAEKGGFADRIPNGDHEVRIEDVFYENKDGVLRSSNGDPQIRIIVRDQQARECMMTITLSEKAGWVLAKLLKCSQPKVDLKALRSNGIEPSEFANPMIGDKYLLGLQFMARVSSEPRLDKDGKDTGKENVRVDPIVDDLYRRSSFLRAPEERRMSKPKQRDDRQRHTAVAEDDIPF